jgi:hypothetical protein
MAALVKRAFTAPKNKGSGICAGADDGENFCSVFTSSAAVRPDRLAGHPVLASGWAVDSVDHPGRLDRLAGLACCLDLPFETPVSDLVTKLKPPVLPSVPVPFEQKCGSKECAVQ